MINKIVLLFLFSFCLLNAKTVNSIIATVNNEPITQYDLTKAIKSTGLNSSAALDLLIKNKLILSQIKKLGITASSSEIVDRINFIAKQNNMDFNKFQETLKKRNIKYEDFRNDIKETILKEKLFDGLLADSEQQIDAKNIRDFYNENSKLFSSFDSISVTRYVSPNKDSLVALMSTFGKLPDNVQSEEITYRPSQIDPNLLGLLLNTKAGNYTPILKASNGFFGMFLVKSINGKKTQSFESTKNDIANMLSEKNRKQVIDDYIEKLRTSAIIKRM